MYNFSVFSLAMVSAMVYTLPGHTLGYWLADLKVSKKALGLLSISYFIHASKILWVPFFERIKVPFLNKILDIRSSWIFLMMIIPSIGFFILSFRNPLQNQYIFVSVVLLSVFCMSTMDPLLRAHFYKLSNDQNIKKILTLGNIGFRTGLYLALNIYVLISNFVSWNVIYRISSLFMIVASFTIFLLPREKEEEESNFSFKEMFIEPYRDFVSKHKQYLVSVIAIMFLFRLQDKLISPVFYCYFVELGESLRGTISAQHMKYLFSASKIIGGFTAIAGSLASNYYLNKYSYKYNFFISAILHSLSCLPLLLLNNFLQSQYLIVGAILIEKTIRGFASNTFYVYQTSLCSKKYASSQLALLSLSESFGSALIGSCSGYAAEYLGWNYFFILAALISLPVLLFLKALPKNLVVKKSKT
ncbi:MFS transporter [Candidatus Nesciobacter abundans]|uniref:MFS transporter n=1 Tax=Candidatus Nesciobacter abundans TaxID=2601668 RepID=UPI0016535E3A|nr:MFS transporter [Candidatus Nesciobacter abundans]